ncbi:branched-chain amino acid ABC transporter substrate-binding protein [Bradyrhizobium glycinis]|uniref:branched-chain amino acid ABC transporter substrate-binding protein n=1 Tax=Bradyrhizobium glycinis TaxID=2751812 RepID=UPI001FE4547E|nr:branched-chain amino acid ABC transporter substrate-binding protein [Bradyrhizobium glycinis]
MLNRHYASAASAALLFWALASAARGSEVNIAMTGPMNGKSAVLGLQTRDSAAAAIEVLNASGRLPDLRMISSVAYSACDPSQAVAIANRFATGRLRMVIDHSCSSLSVAVSGLYVEAGIVQLSFNSTIPRLTERSLQIVFRICSRHGQHGAAAAEYIHRNFPNDKIAVLGDRGTTGTFVADLVESQLEMLGQHVIRQSYVAGETDFTALVSRMEKDGVRTVYIAGCHTEIAYSYTGHPKQGGRIVTVSDTLMTSEFFDITSSAGDGTVFDFMSAPPGLPMRRRGPDSSVQPVR